MQILTGISFAAVVVELVVVEPPAEMMTVEVEAIVAVFDLAAVAKRISAVVVV